ncbi:hypothetical protein LSAT2_024964 [Lamellibrachia satsuma]|nr:hypothetical protein LSAT2_024964 [Lamellibrachia satsuma]
MTNNTLKTAFYHTRVAIESEEDEPTSRPFKPTSHYSSDLEVVYLTWLEQEVKERGCAHITHISDEELAE